MRARPRFAHTQTRTNAHMHAIEGPQLSGRNKYTRPRRRSQHKHPSSDRPRVRWRSWSSGSLPPRSGSPKGRQMKKVHGHSLLRLSRGTNAAELLFCSAKVRPIPYPCLLERRGRVVHKGIHPAHLIAWVRVRVPLKPFTLLTRCRTHTHTHTHTFTLTQVGGLEERYKKS